MGAAVSPGSRHHHGPQPTAGLRLPVSRPTQDRGDLTIAANLQGHGQISKPTANLQGRGHPPGGHSLSGAATQQDETAVFEDVGEAFGALRRARCGDPVDCPRLIVA
jgi:hypothetical protein